MINGPASAQAVAVMAAVAAVGCQQQDVAGAGASVLPPAGWVQS